MTVTPANDREQLLQAYGRFYGAEKFAVAFTATIQGDNAKRVTTSGWDTTRPLADADHGAGLIGERGKTRNVAIVLRPSNLIVLECDTEDDLLRIQALELPTTITVRSSKPYKRHFYFRPPEHLEQLPYVAFRFESGKLTADSGRYFLAPPSIHPSGAVYSFLPDLGPDDVDIAEIPEATYRMLAGRARQETDEQRERIHVDPDAKVVAGQRGDSIFRYASMLRRWGLSRDQIARAAHEWNQARCEPPIEHARVEMQVDGAMKKRGDQELERAQQNPLPDEDTPAHDGNMPRVDLTAPEYQEPPEPPKIAGLLYAAKRHVLSGPQESAKTLIAYHLLLQALRDGYPVAIVDFEMGPTAARRLLADLGATKDELAAIYYTEPQGPPTDTDLELLEQHGVRYVLIDAAAGAFDTTGLDDNSRKDAETFARLWIRPLWQRDIATLLLDHVVKNAEARGKYAIGSERKTGSADVHLGFDALKALSRGGQGMVKVTVHKDRGGYLTRPTAAVLDLASSPDDHTISVAIRQAEPHDAGDPFRPTVLMERVSAHLQTLTEPVSFTKVKESVTGEDRYIAVALERLIEEGYATETTGPRNARLVQHKAMFTGQNPPLRTPAEPLRAGVTATPARASISAGVAGVETPTHADAGVDVYDPAIQSLLDDDIPF